MKLTLTEANQYIALTFKIVKNNPELRVGQALFNILPKETSNIVYNTDRDFFYWTDAAKVMLVFFEDCVEG